jgi:type II secretion system protein I
MKRQPFTSKIATGGTPRSAADGRGRTSGATGGLSARAGLCVTGLHWRTSRQWHPQYTPQRTGITLLEVILSLTIFLMAITILSELMTRGMDAALQAQLKTEAVFRCESKLNEVAVNPSQMTTQDGTFDDDNSWTWSVQQTTGPQTNLLDITVTVTHQSDNPAARVSTTFRRYIRDPQIYIDAQLAAAEEESLLSEEEASP